MDLHFAWTKTSEGQLNWASQPEWKRGSMPNRDRTQEVSLKTGTVQRRFTVAWQKSQNKWIYKYCSCRLRQWKMSVLSVCTLWAFTTHFHVRPSWTGSCHKIAVVPTRLKVCKETMKCCPFTSAHDYTNDHTQTHCWVERDSKQQENINTQKMCWIITCLHPFLKKYSTK